jgi:hypothetical protein
MQHPTTRRLIPAASWNRYHIYPSQRALRNLIFKADRNGLAVAIRRVGRRVLIDEAEFFAWVDRHGGQ